MCVCDSRPEHSFKSDSSTKATVRFKNPHCLKTRFSYWSLWNAVQHSFMGIISIILWVHDQKELRITALFESSTTHVVTIPTTMQRLRVLRSCISGLSGTSPWDSSVLGYLSCPQQYNTCEREYMRMDTTQCTWITGWILRSSMQLHDDGAAHDPFARQPCVHWSKW